MPVSFLTQRLPLKPRPVVAVGGSGSSLMTGLAAHWHLDEPSGTRTDSVGDYHLSEVGAVPQIAGKLGSAGLFSGNVANYLARTTGLGGLAWPVNGQFECNLWFYLHDNTVNQHLLNLATSPGSNRTCSLAFSNTAGCLRAWANGAQMDLAAFGRPATNVWIQVSFGDNGVNSFWTVNNGALTTDVRGGGVGATVITAVHLGVTETLTTPFNGRMDCPSLWLGRSLTAAERTALYNAGAGKDYPY